MAFHQYLALPAVIDITSTDKTDALVEMTNALCKAIKIRTPKPVLFDVFKHEEAASSFIGQGIAIPQAHAPLKQEFAIAVGRSRLGINYDAARGALARILVMVFVRKEVWDTDRHIELLAEIASCFKSDLVHEEVLSAKSPVDVLSIITSFDSGSGTQSAGPQVKAKKEINPVLSAALLLVKTSSAEILMVFSDAVRDNEFLDKLKGHHSLIVVTSNKTRFAEDDKRIKAIIQAPSVLSDRIGQMKIGVLLALSRGLVKKEDKIVCVSGNSKNGTFDTVVALDIDKEYEFFFTAARTIIPEDVQPEVLERVLGLAGEIAVEGREGKPIGTIFVLGDTNSVNAYVRQLIINPFRGYSEAERNIMDPGLDETIKEFAAIDGAFVITGDGIVISAGSYLRPQAEIDPLPGGLGARHVAAAGITACSNALAVTISQSTGMVTLFKNGSIVLSVAKPAVQGRGVVQKM
jgi:DNA integrity scanning protein DisA with diadenylate cyclase activity/mannitol/fructose-specific phosphotransferase system IIA component (Ntr-type)